MDIKPKISIITPCLNSEKTIRDTMESVLHQTYKNIEYIIVDGGSEDRTLEIIHEYEHLFNGRLKYISEKDNGIYDAMNKGIRQSKGKLIGIIGSDDYYETDAVEKVAAHMTKDVYQVLYGYCRVLDGNRMKNIDRKNHKALVQAMLPHATCFVTREIYRDFGMFLTVFKIAGDYELIIRLYCDKRVIFTQIKEILANFRIGGASSSKKSQVEKAIIRRYYKLISFRHLLKSIIELYL